MEEKFEFLKTKFKISEQTFPVKFMRLMPPSFPYDSAFSVGDAVSSST